MTTVHSDCEPKNIGIRFSPPAVILIYVNKNVRDKLRKYVMPVRNFHKNSTVTIVAQDLKTRHCKMLNNISIMKIEKMLRLLQENMKGLTLDEALKIVNKEFTIEPDEDFNKLGETELQRKKHLMDETFDKNHVTPENPEFVYDKQVDFNENIPDKVESGWDEGADDKDDFWS